MYLTYRLAQIPDLEICYPFIQARLQYGPELCKPFLALWKELMEEGCSIALVIEDRDLPPLKTQIGLGFAFFATDRFVEEAKSTLPPYLPLQMLEMPKKGIKPFLSKKEVLNVHSGEGLNIVVTHWGVDPRYKNEDYLKVIQYMSQSFQEIVKTHRLKEFLEEVYGEFERNRLATFGLSCKRDYREFLGTPHLPSREIGERHPYLMGVVMQEIRREADKTETIAGKQALLGPPRFDFLLKEQEVLKRALIGETDEEIAEGLRLTCVAIKKRWQGIYEKVERVEPAFFSDPPVSRERGSAKLKKKRRFLLSVLREHPEELWPNRQPPRRKRS